jgi:hypothetical protein
MTLAGCGEMRYIFSMPDKKKHRLPGLGGRPLLRSAGASSLVVGYLDTTDPWLAEIACASL